MSGEELVKYALQREQDDKKIYKDYMKKSNSQGLRQLLASVIEQEEEHERELQEIIERDDIETLFNAKDLSVFQPDAYNSSTQYLPDMSVNDFLNHVIEREETAVRFYSSLAGMCTQDEVTFIFNNLSFEEQKHKGWAVNRYELEMLAGL